MLSPLSPGWLSASNENETSDIRRNSESFIYFLAGILVVIGPVLIIPDRFILHDGNCSQQHGNTTKTTILLVCLLIAGVSGLAATHRSQAREAHPILPEMHKMRSTTAGCVVGVAMLLFLQLRNNIPELETHGLIQNLQPRC